MRGGGDRSGRRWLNGKTAAITASLAALILGLSAGPAAARIPSEFFGIVKGDLPLEGSDFQKMNSAHVRSVRFILFWAAVQPTPGPPDWSSTDEIVGNLAASGIRPLPFVWGSPSWVASEARRPPLDTPEAKQAWQSFLQQAVQRYGPGGEYWTNPLLYPLQHPGAAQKPIRGWQIWNEPNLAKFFFPHRGAIGKYAALVRLAHDAIDPLDPGATIVLAGMPGFKKPSAWNFLDGLYRKRGFKREFEAVALHPYAHNLRQLAFESKKLRGVVKKHNDRKTPLWITEMGWGSANNRFPLNKGLR